MNNLTFSEQKQLEEEARKWSTEENEKERTYQKQALVGERKYNAAECEKHRVWQAEQNEKDRVAYRRRAPNSQGRGPG
jgi:hypothetical protein